MRGSADGSGVLHGSRLEVGAKERKGNDGSALLRLTPRLLRTCRTDLVTHCHLPTDWSMSQDMDDVQVGMYLGCLYQKRQLVCCGRLRRCG